MNNRILFVIIGILVVGINALVVFIIVNRVDSKYSHKESSEEVASDLEDVADNNIDERVVDVGPKYKISVIDEASQAAGQAIANNYEILGCVMNDLSVPANAVVFAAGNYSGKEINYQIDNSGNQAGQIDVIVNHTKNPVILVLGAYDPTIWNVMWTKDTNIIGVYASGYHRQVIAGIKNGTPTLINSYDNNTPCGEYFYIESDGLIRANNASQKMFGKDIAKAYLSNEGEVVVGDGVEFGVEVLTSNAYTPESFFDKNAPMSGNAGLDDAVRKGIIRLATPDDMRAWQEANMAGKKVPELVGGGAGSSSDFESSMHSGVFVVLKSFQYPAGLFGAHSVTFFIPKGVPKPTGDPGHSVVLDFETVGCAGPACGSMR